MVINEVQPSAIMPESSYKARKDLAILDDLSNQFRELGGFVLTTGGYARDAHFEQLTEFHHDVDIKAYIPPIVLEPDLINLVHRLLPKEHWNHVRGSHMWEVISQEFLDEPLSQRVDFHFFPLAAQPQNNILLARERATINTYAVPVQKKVLFDSEEVPHEIWVEPVGIMAAFLLHAIDTHTMYHNRRSLRPSDTINLLKLLSHPEFNKQQAIAYLIDLYTLSLKLSHQDAFVLASKVLESWLNK
jgi:hypothetical protein